jgi:hypothetical protein
MKHASQRLSSTVYAMTDQQMIPSGFPWNKRRLNLYERGTGRQSRVKVRWTERLSLPVRYPRV